VTAEHQVLYDERLYVPVWVWGVAIVLASSLGIAFGAALGAPVGWTVFALAGGIAIGLLVAAAGRVRVDRSRLVAGRATLPVTSVGRVLALDRREAARLRGREADPRAFLYLKGWVPTAVRVDLVDRVDPTPYWYVTTRQPDRLADALIEAREARPGPPDGSAP
jgi:hypothetical protein